MASHGTPSVNDQARVSFSPHSKAEANPIKAQISGRIASSGISDVAFASVYSEKRCLKNLMIMIIVITSNRKTIY